MKIQCQYQQQQKIIYVIRVIVLVVVVTNVLIVTEQVPLQEPAMEIGPIQVMHRILKKRTEIITAWCIWNFMVWGKGFVGHTLFVERVGLSITPPVVSLRKLLYRNSSHTLKNIVFHGIGASETCSGLTTCASCGGSGEVKILCEHGYLSAHRFCSHYANTSEISHEYW